MLLDVKIDPRYVAAFAKLNNFTRDSAEVQRELALTELRASAWRAANEYMNNTINNAGDMP